MRIAFVCTGLGHGGAETQLIALASRLHALGHAVLVLTLFAGTARVTALRALGVQVIEHNKRARLDWALLRQLHAELRAFRPEVVQGMLFDGNLYARLASLGLGAAVVSSERSSGYALRPMQRWAHRLTRRMTDAVIANSFAGSALSRGLYPHLAADAVHVVWNGIDVEAVTRRAGGARGLRAEWGLDERAQLLCFVGSIKPEKDVLLALSTAASLFAQQSERPWQLVLVGAKYDRIGGYQVAEYGDSSRYARSVEDAIADLPQSRLHRLGIVDNVIEVVAQCDVLISTSLREGFPNVVLEAMAAGTPVVSTRYSDIARILPAPWQIVERRDPALLAATVERAEGERDMLAAAQKAWVREHADLERMTERTLQVYRSCLERG